LTTTITGGISPSASRTPSPLYQSPTISPTPTQTAIPTPTLTPPPPVGSDTLDNFEDGDLIGIDGGPWTDIVDAGGSSGLVELAAGCGYGTVIHSGRCYGNVTGLVAGAWAGMNLSPDSRDCRVVVQRHADGDTDCHAYARLR